MGPIIGLGLKGANKLIDQHFDKLPDRAFHPDHPIQRAAYRVNPKNLSRRHRQKRYAGFESSSSSEESGEEEDEDIETGIRKRQTEPTPSQQHSSQTPRIRTQGLPPPPIGQSFFTPESPGLARARENGNRDLRKARQEWDEAYYSDAPRATAPRRPKAITRRSSSHPPRWHRHPASPSASRSPSSGLRDKAHDKAHRYELKDETVGRFGASPEGITGSVFGAVLGGWAAQKALIATGKERSGGRKRDEAGNKAVTLAGAVIGGLAVNAVVERWQKGREEEEVKRHGKGQRKFGEDSELRGSRGTRRGDGSDDDDDEGRRRGRRGGDP